MKDDGRYTCLAQTHLVYFMLWYSLDVLSYVVQSAVFHTTEYVHQVLLRQPS